MVEACIVHGKSRAARPPATPAVNSSTQRVDSITSERIPQGLKGMT